MVVLPGDGDMMTMEGMTQKHFQHRVPKEALVLRQRTSDGSSLSFLETRRERERERERVGNAKQEDPPHETRRFACILIV